MDPSLSLTIAKRRGGFVTTSAHRLGKTPANAGKKYPPEPLTHEEYGRLLKAFSRRGSAGIRNAAMTATGVSGGLRLGEMLALKVSDVDLDGCTIRVLHGKRDRDRVAVIDAQAVAVIERWLKRRHELAVGPRAPLFCQIQGDRRGLPMHRSGSGFREALKDAAVKAGIDKRVHPHCLRHSCAFDLRMGGVDLLMIMEQLGHTRPDTTYRYIRHLAPEERVKLLSARVWGAGPRRPADGGATPDLVRQVAELQALVTQLVERAA